MVRTQILLTEAQVCAHTPDFSREHDRYLAKVYAA
jgi:hypothetical protein